VVLQRWESPAEREQEGCPWPAEADFLLIAGGAYPACEGWSTPGEGRGWTGDIWCVAPWACCCGGIS
jgi:hypothetical protein